MCVAQKKAAAAAAGIKKFTFTGDYRETERSVRYVCRVLLNATAIHSSGAPHIVDERKAHTHADTRNETKQNNNKN